MALRLHLFLTPKNIGRLEWFVGLNAAKIGMIGELHLFFCILYFVCVLRALYFVIFFFSHTFFLTGKLTDSICINYYFVFIVFLFVT